jgi:hypothetical protein
VSHLENCGTCSGTGVKPGSKVNSCNTCRGSGVVAQVCVRRVGFYSRHTQRSNHPGLRQTTAPRENGPDSPALAVLSSCAGDKDPPGELPNADHLPRVRGVGPGGGGVLRDVLGPGPRREDQADQSRHPRRSGTGPPLPSSPPRERGHHVRMCGRRNLAGSTGHIGAALRRSWAESCVVWCRDRRK